MLSNTYDEVDMNKYTCRGQFQRVKNGGFHFKDLSIGGRDEIL